MKEKEIDRRLAKRYHDAFYAVLRLYNEMVYTLNKVIPRDFLFNRRKDFSIISNFILNDIILIPESVSLLSKYPYLEQMEVCLKNIMAVSREETPQIIAHLVNEIYLPQMINTHIIFYLPRSSTPIKLVSPIENKTLSPNDNKLSEINFCVLFKYFTLTKIIKNF